MKNHETTTWPDISMIIQRQATLLKFLPVEVLVTLPMLFHRNAVLNRANQFA